MNLKRKLMRLPLVLALLLMGCSYGCDSKDKAEVEFDEERPVGDSLEEMGTDLQPLEEESLEDVVEEISEEEPVVVPPDSEDISEEDFVDQGESTPESGETYEEDLESERDDRTFEDQRDADPDAETFESEEESYGEEGDVYEDDYPDR